MVTSRVPDTRSTLANWGAKGKRIKRNAKRIGKINRKHHLSKHPPLGTCKPAAADASRPTHTMPRGSFIKERCCASMSASLKTFSANLFWTIACLFDVAEIWKKKWFCGFGEGETFMFLPHCALEIDEAHEILKIARKNLWIDWFFLWGEGRGRRWSVIGARHTHCLPCIK